MAYINRIIVNGAEVNANQLEGILDKDGHARFIEGDGSPETITGFSSSYCKWSLSGSHLMLVLAGTYSNGTTLSGNDTLANYELPEWIRNKIYPVFRSTFIEVKDTRVYADDLGYVEVSIYLEKTASGVRIVNKDSESISTDRHFRFQFDLLIDND